MLSGSKLLTEASTFRITYVGLFSTVIAVGSGNRKVRGGVIRAYERFLSWVPPGSRKRFAKVTETFFTEVGVLLFVFPVLDEFVQNDLRAVTPRLILGSLAASLTCFGVAGALAVFTGEGQE